MSKNDRFRSTGVRSLLLSSLFGLVVASFAGTQGCTGGEVDPPNEEGDGNNANGDRDAGGDPVVEDELTAVIAAIDDGNLDTVFTLDGTGSLNPSGRVVEYAWEVDAPDGDGCEGIIAAPAGPTTTFTPSCRGVHRVTLTVSLVDGSVSSKAEESFSVDNRVPVLSALAADGAFLPGDDVVISATVSDEDDDATTCTARLAGANTGDPTGLTIPSEPSADCSFTILTPARVDVWLVEVTANDGLDDSLPATIELRSSTLPPVIDDVALDVSEAGYACDEEGCASVPVRVTVTATDDVDPFEDLVIDVVDATSGAPEGVTVAVAPVEGEHGVFDVVVSRVDPGPLAGTYTIAVRVSDVTSEAGPATSEQQASFTLVSAAPTVASVTAPDSAHAYDAGGGRYTSTVSVAATAADPEGNLTSVSVALVSCPTAAAGEPACGGADLTIVESFAGDELTLELSTGVLPQLAGTYTFEVTVSDADGLTATQQEEVLVLNAAPTLSAAFVSTADQAYAGGAHTAAFPLVTDPEGDPLTMVLSATCADDSNVASLPGECASGQDVSVGVDGRLTVSGPAPGLLGEYRVQGTISDDVDSYALDATVVVENSPPSIARTSASEVTCDHETSAGQTTNEDGCDYPFAANASDPNGDPLTYSVSMQPDNNYTVTGTLSGSVPGDGALSMTFGVQTSYASFLSRFDDQSQRLRVQVTDPFGAQHAAAMSPLLDNRAPSVSSAQWRSADGAAAPPALDVHEYSSGNERAVRNDSCRFVPFPGGGGTYVCTGASPYELALDVNAADPDGDPLSVALAVSCSDTIVAADGSSPATLRSLPANGLIALEMRGHDATCDFQDVTAGYTYWNTDYTGPYCTGQVPNVQCFPARYKLGCTMTAASSKVTDGIADTALPEDESFTVNVTFDEMFACD